MIRLGIVAVFVVLGVLFFLFGKLHPVLVDNKTVEIQGQTFEAPAVLRYVVDGQEPVEIQARKRKRAELVGPNHKIVVEVLDENDQVLRTVEHKFSIGLHEEIVVNLAVLVGGDQQNWIQANE